jgi:hypothetical protein
VSKKISVIGIEPHELRWIRTLVSLLRHPDPGMPELARQALLYLVKAAGERPQAGPLGPLGEEQPYCGQSLVL